MSFCPVIIVHDIIIHHIGDSTFNVFRTIRETANHIYFIMSDVNIFRIKNFNDLFQNRIHYRIYTGMQRIVGVRNSRILSHFQILTFIEEPFQMPQCLEKRNYFYIIFPADLNKFTQPVFGSSARLMQILCRIPLCIFNFKNNLIQLVTRENIFHHPLMESRSLFCRQKMHTAQSQIRPVTDNIHFILRHRLQGLNRIKCSARSLGSDRGNISSYR